MRKNLRLIGLLTLITAGAGIGAAGCAGHDLASKKEGIPFVGNLEVNRYQLKNGLEVLVVEDHTSPTFAYQTWYDVGSRDEIPGQTGLAHLFEHMMFKETKNLKDGEFDKILERAGTEGLNAFTSHDYTAYVQELPKDKLELITRLEADRMVNLVVDSEAFETETEVVQNERRMRNENSPEGLMNQTIFEVAFDKHSYRWPIIGYQKDLDSMNSKHAEAFYKKYYAPNRATIIVVGDVDSDEVVELVDKYYGHIPAVSGEKPTVSAEPSQKRPRRKTLKLNIEVEKLLMGYRIPPSSHEDFAALAVLQALLADGKSSRLTRALVETGIATSVSNYTYEHKDPSLYFFSVDMQKGKSASAAEAVIMREIKKLHTEQVSDKELERAKNLYQFMFYNYMGSHSAQARFLGRGETVLGDFEKALAINNRIEQVTAKDIQRVVKAYFDPNNRTVIKGVPKS